MIRRRLAALIAAPALAVSLSACVSLLPKTDPDQLYTFGHGIDAAPAAVGPGPDAVGVLFGAVAFPRAATSDGILTMTGNQSAYLAESRWVSPAAVLFREAVERRYDRSATKVRLLQRGETGRAGMILRVEVRDFAALYPNGPESSPTIAVSVNARLSRIDGAPLGERNFEVRRPVSENRVGPIVDGFDKAVNEALTAMVAWTDQASASLPPVPAPMAPPRPPPR